MSLQIRNTKELLEPGKFKFKCLIYGLSGLGKTEWSSSAPNPGFAACETGHGKGLLTCAEKGLSYVEPASYDELATFCSGALFKDKDTLIVDSITAMNTTFIKDRALAIPRTRGGSDKRAFGVPELDDYQVMAELTRRLLAKLLELDKNIVVTAGERYKGPDMETGQGETIIGPDLPGHLMTTSTAMFDFVFRLRTRQKLRTPGDPKSRYVERYLMTQPDGQGTIAKCRSNAAGKPLLDKEIVVDLESKTGNIPYILDSIMKGYSQK